MSAWWPWIKRLAAEQTLLKTRKYPAQFAVVVMALHMYPAFCSVSDACLAVLLAASSVLVAREETFSKALNVWSIRRTVLSTVFGVFTACWVPGSGSWMLQETHGDFAAGWLGFGFDCRQESTYVNDGIWASLWV